MTDELREKAKAFRINSTPKFRMLSTNMVEQLMAMFTAECVRAEREQVAGKIEMIIRHTTDGSLVGFQNLADELKAK